MKAIPVINENDVVSDEEIKFGDNDTLAAMATSALRMDLLLILSDVDGLYDFDPRKNSSALIMEEVQVVDDAILNMAGGSSTTSGTGGMHAKVKAAKIASDGGVYTWIVSGKRLGAIHDALRLGKGGTFFHPSSGGKIRAKKHWLMHVLNPKGIIIVDDGAKKAVFEDRKSLLPSGIIGIEGKFSKGEGVFIADKLRNNFANGITNYDSDELVKIQGKKSSEIEAILKYISFEEVVHKDNLVIKAN
jgi:glutamate 5-kinase